MAMKWSLTFAFLLALGPLAAAQSATIHIYRDRAKFVGIASSPFIYIDGREVSRLGNGHYFEYPVSPGQHVLSMGLTDNAQPIHAEAGGDYYYHWSARLSFGGMAVLIPITREEWEQATRKLSPTRAKGEQ